MMEIEFIPNLEHCVQTLARQEYDRIMRLLLESGEADPAHGDRLEMLKNFLESADFNQLRGEYEPYLVDGKTVIFRLTPGKDGAEYHWETS